MSGRHLQLGVLGLAAILAAGCAGSPAERAAATGAPAAAAADPGIRVEALRLSAAGYMLDFRYRITDPERAAPFLDRKAEPYLLDPVSGARLAIPNTPKLGKLRQVARKDMTGRSYFMLFANPGQFARAGDRLTLVIGDLRLEGLVVEGTGGKDHAQM